MEVQSDQFILAMNSAIETAPNDLYDRTVEEIYQGLWERTTEQLQQALDAKHKYDIPNKMNEYALIYTRLAGMVAQHLIRQEPMITEVIAMNIIRHSAEMIHEQAQSTSRFLKRDLITGKRLLKSGNN